jgi:hypothetical protein
MKITLTIDLETEVENIMNHHFAVIEQNPELNLDVMECIAVGQLFELKALLIELKGKLPEYKLDELGACIDEAMDGLKSSWLPWMRSERSPVTPIK